MRIMSRIAVVDVARAVVVVRPPRVRLVVAGDLTRDLVPMATRVDLDDRLLHHAATVAPVRQLARAELDVGGGIHQILPRDAANVAVRAAFVLVQHTADRHEAAVLRVDLPVACVNAGRLLVHVALVDHHGQQQRRAQVVPLGGPGHRVRDPPALRGRPGWGLPPNLFLYGANSLGEARVGMDLAARLDLGAHVDGARPGMSRKADTCRAGVHERRRQARKRSGRTKR